MTLLLGLACTDPPGKALEDTSVEDTSVEDTSVEDTADTSVEVVGLTVLGPDGPVDAWTALLTTVDLANETDASGRVEYPVGPGWLQIRDRSQVLVGVDLVFNVLPAGEYTVTMKPPGDCDLGYEGEEVVCVELDALPGAPEGRIYALGHLGFGADIRITTADPVLVPGVEGWEERHPTDGEVALDWPTTVVLPL